MESLCKSCILYGRCSGSCTDTDPTYLFLESQNDDSDFLDCPDDYYGDCPMEESNKELEEHAKAIMEELNNEN